MDVQGQILETIRREQLLKPGDRVVVGVSGGPDSLCLLHVLWSARQLLQVDLHVAHLNHTIRGAEAKEDARFVAAVAAEWGLPCHVAVRDVPELARRFKLAIEEAARHARYAFLVDVAYEVGAKRIVVAHNADDQSETVLMHWLRGSALAGLRGMLPAIGIADLHLSVPAEKAQDVRLIRPLLDVDRESIEEYCRQYGLEPRFDRSNLDTTLFRNKLRHELLPHLEQAYKPGFRQILRRSAQVIRADYDLLCRLRESAWAQILLQETARAITIDRSAWQQLHLSLQRATLRYAVQCLRQHLRDVSFEQVEAAVRVAGEKPAGAQATLPSGLLLTVSRDTITIAGEGDYPAPDWPQVPSSALALDCPGCTPLPNGGSVTISVVDRIQVDGRWGNNADPWRAYLDADAVGAGLVLRRRQPGDRFCPLGMQGQHKSVGEFLINESVPAQWRDLVPILVQGNGQIVWVCGWRIDERVRVTDKTTRVMVVQFDPASEDRMA